MNIIIKRLSWGGGWSSQFSLDVDVDVRVVLYHLVLNLFTLLQNIQIQFNSIVLDCTTVEEVSTIIV